MSHRAATLGRAVSLLWHPLRPTESASASTARAIDRDQRAGLTTVVGIASSGIALLTTLVSVPLTLGYLGTERYGLWMTMASIMALLGFTDLGIGNGLMNALARARGRDDMAAAGRYVTSGLAVITALAIVVGAAIAIAFPLVPWHQIYNVHSSRAVEEAGPATMLVAIWLVGRIPLGTITSIRSAYQEGYINHAFTAVGNLLALAFLLLAINAKLGLPVLVSSLALAPFLALLLNLLLLLGRDHPELRPRRRNLDAESAKEVVRVGLAYFVLQIAFAVGYLSDTIVLAQIMGPEAVADYSVVTKLFLIPLTLATLIVSPLWPAYREAYARGELAWVRTTLRRSLNLVAAITIPTGVLIAWASGPLFRLWIGESFAPEGLLVAAAAVSMIVLSFKNALSMLFNGLQIVKFQLVTAVSMAIINLALSIVLTMRIGMSGVLWGSAIAALVTTIVPDVIYVRARSVLKGGTIAGPPALPSRG